MPKDAGPAEGQRKNTAKYMAEPVGIMCMVEADLVVGTDAVGQLYMPHTKIDDLLEKGTVLAVGPDVKTWKPGDRVQYLFNGIIELDQFYRENFNPDGRRKGLIKEGDILMHMKQLKAGEKPTGKNWSEGLSAEDHAQERQTKLRSMEARRKVIR